MEISLGKKPLKQLSQNTTFQLYAFYNRKNIIIDNNAVLLHYLIEQPL